MKESPLNVYLTEEGVGNYRKNQWQMNFKDLIIKPGEFVKLAFKATNGDVEWMWVTVNTVDSEKDEYTGVLNNDPVLDMVIKDGDPVTFKREDVAEWLAG